MSTEGELLFNEHYAHIQQMIDAALRSHKPNLSQAIGGLSPTRYPTPTGNAPGGYTPAAHTHPWSDITSTPTTLSGYGITDAQPLDSDLTAIAGLSTTSYGRGFLPLSDAAAARTYIGVTAGGGTVTSVNITAPAAGITASGGPVTTSGAIILALANDLAALEGLGSTGLAARTAADTWAQRAITGTSARITVTNGDGVAGNPTIDIGTGYVGQASITTLGTVGTGVWQGTKVGLAYGGTNADLSATGGAGQYLKQASAGAAVTVGAIPYGDLVYSSLTTGQVLRATGASAAAFGALDLANTNAVTGLLAGANGGTGVNNGSFLLTVPATGTVALLGTAQTFSETNVFQKIVWVPLTSGTTGYGLRFGDGTNAHGNFQALDLGGVSYIFFVNGRQFDGTAWQLLDSRVAGLLQLTGDRLNFYTFAASATTPVSRFQAGSDGAFLIGRTSGLSGAGDLDANGDGRIGSTLAVGSTSLAAANTLHLSSGTGVGLRIDGSGNTATTATAGAQTLPLMPVGFWVVSFGGTSRKIPYYAT
jgi:hypothetical protein